MIKTMKIVIEGEVDEIILKRIPGEGYAAKDMIEASFVLKDQDRQFCVKSNSSDWPAIDEQCRVAMSEDVVSITGDISVDGVLVGHAGELTLGNTAVTKLESADDPSYSE